MSLEDILLDNLSERRGESKSEVIIKTVIKLVRDKELNKGDKLPSLKSVASLCGISANTVVKAYDELKRRGILEAVFGQGFYIATDSVDQEYNVFLLFDELNMFKEELYNEFKRNIDGEGRIDMYFHHFNNKQFTQLISENRDRYTHYVIMSLMGVDNSWIEKYISPRHLLILDSKPWNNALNFVTQDLDGGTYAGLSTVKERIKKYTSFNYIFPPAIIEEAGNLVKRGFLRFCKENGVFHDIIYDFQPDRITKGEVYLIARDKDLVKIIKEARRKGMVVGEDIGVISYNETELKEIIEGGITVISTDFTRMGQLAADFVRGKREVKQETIPTEVILRSSL